jgi:hypothetical protein
VRDFAYGIWPNSGMHGVSIKRKKTFSGFCILFCLLFLFFCLSNSFPNLNAGNCRSSSFLTGPRVGLATVAASNHVAMHLAPPQWNSCPWWPFQGHCATCPYAGLAAQRSSLRWTRISVQRRARLQKIWKLVPVDETVRRSRTWHFSHTLYTCVKPDAARGLGLLIHDSMGLYQKYELFMHGPPSV